MLGAFFPPNLNTIYRLWDIPKWHRLYTSSCCYQFLTMFFSNILPVSLATNCWHSYTQKLSCSSKRNNVSLSINFVSHLFQEYILPKTSRVAAAHWCTSTQEEVMQWPGHNTGNNQTNPGVPHPNCRDTLPVTRKTKGTIGKGHLCKILTLLCNTLSSWMHQNSL